MLTVVILQLHALRSFLHRPQYRTASQSQSQGHSYFTTGGLPPISSSWRKAPWDSRPVFFSTEHLRLQSLCNILSDERMGLSFIIAAGPRQHSILGSESRILLPQIGDSPNLEDHVPVFISPRNRVAQLYPPGTGFNFRRLLWLAWLWWRYSNPPPHGQLHCQLPLRVRVRIRVRVTLLLAVYRQSVRLGASPLKLTTSNFVFPLNTCYSPYVTFSLTRGWVCRLQLLLVIASAVILRSESRGTHDHILLSQIRHSPNLEGQIPIFISPRRRVARL
jgi:hypothetical protein